MALRYYAFPFKRMNTIKAEFLSGKKRSGGAELSLDTLRQMGADLIEHAAGMQQKGSALKLTMQVNARLAELGLQSIQQQQREIMVQTVQGGNEITELEGLQEEKCKLAKQQLKLAKESVALENQIQEKLKEHKKTHEELHENVDNLVEDTAKHSDAQSSGAQAVDKCYAEASAAIDLLQEDMQDTLEKQGAFLHVHK